MQNKYPLWKNLLLIALFIIGVVYSSPMIFGEDPAIQISAKGTAVIDKNVEQKIAQTLKTDNLKYLSIAREKTGLLVRFPSTDIQLKSRDIIADALGENYIVALNLAPKTPKWLLAIGAEPMKLGLDLRGGVHFLLDVDVDALVEARQKGSMHTIGSTLRAAEIRYTGIKRVGPTGMIVNFNDNENMEKAYSKLNRTLSEYQLTRVTEKNTYAVKAILTQPSLVKINNYAIDQAMNILRNRVNALGVSEAIVQQQGKNQISVDLPGIQDTAGAKSIIGKVATLRFQMVDEDHDVQSAIAGNVPIGSKIYFTEQGRPVLLKDAIILRGDSITYATSSFDQAGKPSVNVRLGSGDIAGFNRVTGENVGKSMAAVYVEPKLEKKKIAGKIVTIRKKVEKVISVATIQSALGASFEITGLESPKYAQNLALLLRSGALLAPINIVQERTVGPSLGASNIHQGLLSVVIGFLAVVFFMLIYYHFFGIVADMALFLNLIFIIAVFSILGVTLTLPGIAAMVLTVGMAVDANVLIYERIREELRNGISPQASIHIGYERAFVTIVDSNVTTLIVALVLFALGSGAVKGFAVTLIVGLLTSMVTAVVFTRAVVNAKYGGKMVKKLSIGIINGTI